MKTLDRKASEILQKLLALQKLKIDNTDGVYMPVHIEIIEKTDKYNHISLAHYGQQNGDAMRDPKCSLPCTKKHSNSFRTITAMTTAASSRTA